MFFARHFVLEIVSGDNSVAMINEGLVGQMKNR